MKTAKQAFFAGGILLLGTVFVCAEKIQPTDAPIVHFKLPGFNDEGYRTWGLEGEQGRYLGQDKLKVWDVKLSTFSGCDLLKLESTILSPEALIEFKERKASGDQKVYVEGPNYAMEGNKWNWSGNEKKVIVNDGVHVTFKEALATRLFDEAENYSHEEG